MAVTIVPAQDGNTISAPFFNANIRAILNAIDALETSVGGTISDLHGDGVLWGFFTSVNNGILTVSPGVAYVNGLRISKASASNFTLPSSAVSHVWLRYHSAESERVVLSNTSDITYYQNTDTLHITYPEADEAEDRLYEQIADEDASGGSYHAIYSGDVVLSFEGEGKIQLVYAQGPQGCSASIYHRYKQDDGSWSEWTQSGLANTSINCSGSASQGNTALLLSGQVGATTERQIKLVISGGEDTAFYLDTFKHYKSSQVAPSSSATLLHKIITDHNGEITSETDERSSLSLNKSEWEELFKTKYRLLSEMIVCTQCFYDPFLDTTRLDYEECTAYVDTQQHEVRLEQNAPYTIASGGEIVLEGQGRVVTETLALNEEPYSLSYSKIKSGTMLVRSTNLSTVYTRGYVVDYDNGTIAYDTDEEDNPITEGQIIRVDYTGVSQTTLSTRLTGQEAQNISVEVTEGSADYTNASRTLVDSNGNDVVELTPKSGFPGAEGNSIKVIIEEGSNQENTIADLQLYDQGLEPAICMEVKSKESGEGGNAIRVSVADATMEKIINGGFEDGIGDWVTDDGGVGTWQADSAEAHSGLQSLQADKTSGGGQMIVYRLHNCKAGSTYRTSLWFKSAGAFDITGTLYILSGDRATEFGSTEFLNSSNLNGDWAKATLDVAVPSTNQQLTFYIAIAGSGQGEVWVDDLSIELRDVDSFALTVQDADAEAYIERTALLPANATASSGTPAQAIDGDRTTSWTPGAEDDDLWWKYDFGATSYIQVVGVYVEPSDNTEEIQVAVDTGDDNESYTQIGTITVSRGWQILRLRGALGARYLRLRATQNADVGITEVGVWSATTSNSPECPVTSSLVGNLLPYNSFENWETRESNLQPVGWTCYINDVADDGQQENTLANVIAGEKSAAVIEDSTGYTYRYDSNAISGLDTDAKYVVGTWVKIGSITAGSEVYAEIVPLDEGSVEQTAVRLVDSSGNAAQTSAGGWMFLAVNYSPAFARMKLRLVVDGPAHVWWDNASVHLYEETFDNLTLDSFDPALNWPETPNYAVSTINTTGTGSALVTVVDLTTANDFPHSSTVQNPNNVSSTYLSGGDTLPITVKVTLQKYLYTGGAVTETLEYQTVLDNLTLDKSNIPGSGDADNRDLITTINNYSNLVEATYLLGDQDDATWQNNPVVSSGYLSGGLTAYNTVNIISRKGSAETFEAEDLADYYTADGSETISADFSGSWQEVSAGLCSSGAQYVGTPDVEGLSAYLFIRGPVVSVDLIYTANSQYGNLNLALARLDAEGNIGTFSAADSRLEATVIDQSGDSGYQQSVTVLKHLFEEYADGQPVIYCLRIQPDDLYSGSPINIDAIVSYTQSYKEELADLTYDVQDYTNNSGKLSLLTAINTGVGNVGPSLLLSAASENTYTNSEDNPELIAATEISGATGASRIIYSQIITDDDWGTIPQFYLFAEEELTEYTDIAYEYTLNPRDTNPTWVPCQHGILTTTSAEAGQHEIQIRAVLSTENAGETPVLHDWGIFWGEPSYTPENIEIKTATGNLTITCNSSGTVRVPVGFNVVNATINITSILLVADSSMYGYPYFDHPLGYIYEYGYGETTQRISGSLGTSYQMEDGTTIESLPVGYDNNGFTLYYNGPHEAEITIEWTAEGWM
jgi:hypothetical protein